MRDYSVALSIVVLLLAVTGATLLRIAASVDRIEVRMSVQPVSLPERCAPHYNDGTTAWIDCMGVGYVGD